ncbi:Decaprenyl diphosphate synthase-like protein, partial [Gaertneriomyces semiglobifer]
SGVWSTAQRAMANILKLGPIPRHVGFIMDGNRRYAKKVGMHTMVGHMLGSKKLEETLEWCLKLGVQVVTVYAFSIENFKRPELEVSTLMDLARKKFEEFSKHSTFVAENSIRIRVLGDLSLLPPHVLDAARRAEYTTRNNSKATLNICFPYTSRHELASSMVLAVRGVREGYIEADDVGELLLDELMMTGDDPPLDVLVRTSGERRLSDFLLWQVTMPCQIHFLDVLWPEFTFWDMLPVLRSYQANYSRIRIER